MKPEASYVAVHPLPCASSLLRIVPFAWNRVLTPRGVRTDQYDDASFHHSRSRLPSVVVQ